MLPTCLEGCSNPVPIPLFNECTPEANAGEIEKIFMTTADDSAVLTDWTDLAEWNGRLVDYETSQSSYSDDVIIELTVIGDKPQPTENMVPLSGDREKSLNNEHIINFRIDETNQTNHDWVRKMQCNGGGRYRVWYQTSGGLLFGGNEGTLSNVKVYQVIPESRSEVITYNGTIKWRATHLEERINSPMAA